MRLLLIVIVIWLAAAIASPISARADDFWFSGEGDSRKVTLYFFYSDDCPHCTAAKPVIGKLAEQRPWLDVKALEVGEEDNERLFFMLARGFGREPEAVPSFFICKEMIVGFDGAAGTGGRIAAIAETCRKTIDARSPAPVAETPPPSAQQIELPLIGRVDATDLSLPVLTLVIGGLDAFNPCAFFVLLFLLSLMVHAKSRGRMALVGGVFVTVSGVMYFIFMAAWLNLFLLLHNIAWITTLAGLLAIAIGALAVKDFFYFREGPSLSIPDGAKPKLFRRIGRLTGEASLPMLLAGTMLLAITANMYELLCTSGFPMIYTRILTQNELSLGALYAYLAAYNVVYVTPLMMIVGLFVATLGGRKLSEQEGRVLKLLSGLMMLGLGVLLVVAPDLLTNVLAAILLLVAALALTLVISRLMFYESKDHTT